ncbi:hypothetical protein BWQ96_02392 [Gracilariopsis chorda]|uniref:PiggyBac transposable element-derived protein domain-containing protein n=1 Tax=Gracilariopsis chorda TaxID=448386 RepID=A0A2V3J2T7_9FLOR|nr:hypothetical protein BWQ96_02392 [Gracilariopsis chorda]|eukprot:PXF47710.1 hypothetical protein BWQ96_02392 [Gracilariopsis chorda]
MEVPIPKIVDSYYQTFSHIDGHNGCRQEKPNLEGKMEVKDWAVRLHTILLAICIVDVWLLYKGNMVARNCWTQKDFYAKLAEQLIDNSYDVIGIKQRSNADEEISEARMVSGTGIHLLATNNKRKLNND